MSSGEIVTKDTPIAEVMRLCPRAPEIFHRYGMDCSVCLAASAETVEEGASMHDVDVQAIVDELNAACGEGAE